MQKYTKEIFGLLILIIVVLSYNLFIASHPKEAPSRVKELAVEEIDNCKNIEGIQKSVPSTMMIDKDNNCILIVKKETVHTVLSSEKNQISSPTETINAPSVLSEKENIVEVKIFEANTFNEVHGYDQSPASVGYKFRNLSSKDVTIEGIYFNIKTVGDFDIDGSSLFSVSWNKISKAEAFTLPDYNSKNFVHYEFPESVTIPANGSRTLYINLWKLSGDLRYYTVSKTIYTLSKIDSIMPNTVFDLGPNSSLITQIPHKQP
jgi:hypothetical protein